MINLQHYPLMSILGYGYARLNNDYMQYNARGPRVKEAPITDHNIMMPDKEV